MSTSGLTPSQTVRYLIMSRISTVQAFPINEYERNPKSQRPKPQNNTRTSLPNPRPSIPVASPHQFQLQLQYQNHSSPCCPAPPTSNHHNRTIYHLHPRSKAKSEKRKAKGKPHTPHPLRKTIIQCQLPPSSSTSLKPSHKPKEKIDGMHASTIKMPDTDTVASQ